MKTWVRKTLSVGVLAAGALLFAPMAAQADAGQIAADNNGALNATQIIAPVTAPINIAGVGVGILGEGTGMGEAGSAGAGESGSVTQAASGSNGVLNATQAYLPVNVPVNVAGIGVGVLGEGHGEGSAWTESTTESGDVTQSSSDNNGALNGTQVYLPVNLPINIAGVGVGILGEGHGEGSASSRSTESGEVTQASSDNNGAANGTQVYAPVNVPINIAGVGLGVLGEGHGAGTASSGGGNAAEGATQASDGNNGAGNGTQVFAPVTVPVCVAGVGIGVLGEGHGEGSCENGGGSDGGEEPTYPTNPDDEEPTAEPDGDYTDQPRGARKAAKAAKAETTALDGLTQGGNALNLGGLDLLNTLR